MLGFSLRISELKCPLSRKLSTEARRLGEKSEASASCLRDALQGDTVSYSEVVTPWWSVRSLVELVEEHGEGGTVLRSSGYPLMLTARGSTIISRICKVEGSLHGELSEILDPTKLYFLEAWDLS